MEATIYLDGSLSRFYSGDPPIYVSAGISLHQAKTEAGLPASIPVSALVNGVVSDLNYCLKPGDEVHLIPQIAGG
jgi:molybdopterin converting factor small subunit